MGAVTTVNKPKTLTAGNFLNQTEEDRIKKLCISVESNEKLFLETH